MGHPKVATACLLLVLVASGCASLRWSLQKASRSEGTRIVAFPEEVARELRCGERKLPYFAIERGEIVPPRVRAGGEFNHRLVTVLCPEHPTEVASGRLSEAIRFRGRLVYQEIREPFEFRPGRWIQDAMVELPPDAEPGVYAYELRFDAREVSFAESWSFVVDAGR